MVWEGTAATRARTHRLRVDGGQRIRLFRRAEELVAGRATRLQIEHRRGVLVRLKRVLTLRNCTNLARELRGLSRREGEREREMLFTCHAARCKASKGRFE